MFPSLPARPSLPVHLATRIRDCIWPPECQRCRTPVLDSHKLCPACWLSLTLVSAPLCLRCGTPFGIPDRELCTTCIRRPPALAKIRSGLVYDTAARPLLTAFKHGDRADLARLFTALLLPPATGIGAELVTPVPVHRFRMWKRLYNQAALLSARLAQQLSLPHDPLLLGRTRHTPPQTGNAATRRRNLQGAITLIAPASRVRNRHILLVDDVMTTGATLEICAGTLLEAGAAQVSAVVVARVIPGTQAFPGPLH